MVITCLLKTVSKATFEVLKLMMKNDSSSKGIGAIAQRNTNRTFAPNSNQYLFDEIPEPV